MTSYNQAVNMHTALSCMQRHGAFSAAMIEITILQNEPCHREFSEDYGEPCPGHRHPGFLQPQLPYE